jgi:hypothetical protein
VTEIIAVAGDKRLGGLHDFKWFHFAIPAFEVSVNAVRVTLPIFRFYII